MTVGAALAPHVAYFLKVIIFIFIAYIKFKQMYEYFVSNSIFFVPGCELSDHIQNSIVLNL